MAKSTLEKYLTDSLDWFNTRWTQIQEVIDWNVEWSEQESLVKSGGKLKPANKLCLRKALIDPLILSLPCDKQYKAMDDFGIHCIIHNTPLGPVIFLTRPNIYTNSSPPSIVSFVYDIRLYEYGFLKPMDFIDAQFLQFTLGHYKPSINDGWPYEMPMLGQRIEMLLNDNKSK